MRRRRDVVVYFEGKKRIPGSANFTCNVSYGQVGSAENGYNTLFHEGGHAAHLLNTEETEACVNNEYPPASTAWDETQSMFLDSMLSSIEWATRYAQTLEGALYPFSLFEREVKKLRPLAPLSMNGISSVMNFERAVYEEKNLTERKLISIAKEVYRKFTDTEVDSLRLLSIPHIYSWESACSYQGYGLAQLAVYQWREYFYKKYGFIVDNKAVGKEMRAVWKYGSAKTFPECVKQATGNKLSPEAYLKQITASADTVLKTAKQKIKRLKDVPHSKKTINLHVTIKMVHGKKTILGRMPGDEWQRFANLRLLYGYMFTHPGTKLLFMGSEFGQSSEWNFSGSLDWHLLQYPFHAGVKKLITDLNKLYKTQPALHEKQFSSEGFEWINYSFERSYGKKKFARQKLNLKTISLCN